VVIHVVCDDCISAGQIRCLVSTAALAQRRRHDGHVTLDDVITAVRQLVLVRQCDVFGYVSVDNQLILVVSAVTATPTYLQVGCIVLFIGEVHRCTKI